MRASILALLAGPIIALASPALRVSVTVDEGVGTDPSSQRVLTTDDPTNYPGTFTLAVPGSDLAASPPFPEVGEPLLLLPPSDDSSQVFTLQNSVLSTASPDGPPLAVFTSSSGGPPVLTLGPPDGAPNLQPLKVGVFPSPGGSGLQVLMQFDPTSGSGPVPLSVIGQPVIGARVALLGGGPPVFFQIQQVGD